MHKYLPKQISTETIPFSWKKFGSRLVLSASAFIFLTSVSIIFSGCDATAPDKEPPTLSIQIKGSPNSEMDPQKSTDKIPFGITDTVLITFSEKIDTASLNLTFEPMQNIGFHFDGETKVSIFGKNKGYGSAYFNLNSPFTATLSGLRDQNSNGQVPIQSSFKPYFWADRDFIDSNFRGYDSLFRNDSEWVDGKSIHDSLITEGALDFQKLFGVPDINDMKVVLLALGDTLFATLKTRTDLNLNYKVAGPFLQKDIDSILVKGTLDSSLVNLQTGNSGQASVKITPDYTTYRRKLGDGIKNGLYLFVIRIPEDKSGFYRINARIHKFE